MKRVGLCFVLVFGVFTFPNGSEATLIGDEIMASMGMIFAFELDEAMSGSAVVGAGVEFQSAPYGGVVFSADFGASSITFSMHNVTADFVYLAEYPQFGFKDLDWVGEPGGYVSGLQMVTSDFSGILAYFTDDTIRFDIYGGYELQAGEMKSATYEILTGRHTVPEPMTLTLVGLSIAGLMSKPRRALGKNV